MTSTFAAISDEQVHNVARLRYQPRTTTDARYNISKHDIFTLVDDDDDTVEPNDADELSDDDEPDTYQRPDICSVCGSHIAPLQRCQSCWPTTQVGERKRGELLNTDEWRKTQARLKGERTYQGDRCAKCGGVERYVTGGRCCECVRRAVDAGLYNDDADMTPLPLRKPKTKRVRIYVPKVKPEPKPAPTPKPAAIKPAVPKPVTSPKPHTDLEWRAKIAEAARAREARRREAKAAAAVAAA